MSAARTAVDTGVPSRVRDGQSARSVFVGTKGDRVSHDLMNMAAMIISDAQDHLPRAMQTARTEAVFVQRRRVQGVVEKYGGRPLAVAAHTTVETGHVRGKVILTSDA